MLELSLLALAGGILRISPALAWVVVGDCLTQRSGRFNLGLEGVVPCCAVAALLVAHATGDAWLGVAGAAMAGAAMALVFALCCVLPGVNPLAVGIGFLVGGTALARFAGSGLVSRPAVIMPHIDLAGDLGGTFQFTVLLPASVLLALFLAWLLRRTRIGLRVIAAGGEGAGPALAAVGASAARIRVLATMAGGACAGVGGASLAMSYPGGWSDNLATGVGITALVLASVCRGRPLFGLLAAMAFAAVSSLALALQLPLGTSTHHLLNSLPYLAALLAFCWPAARRARAPA